MFPHNAEVRNKMTVSECRRYINYIADLANRELIEQSTSFAFMKNLVVTYNDEISITHPVEGLNLTGAIKADEFYKKGEKVFPAGEDNGGFCVI